MMMMKEEIVVMIMEEMEMMMMEEMTTTWAHQLLRKEYSITITENRLVCARARLFICLFKLHIGRVNLFIFSNGFPKKIIFSPKCSTLTSMTSKSTKDFMPYN